MPQEAKLVMSVMKAFRLLDILSEVKSPLSLAELSERSGWPKSTVYGLLSSMREKGTLPADGFAVKSLVSTRMAEAICKAFGVACYDVPTGFRFISEKIDESARTGKGTFLFGFEESYGFLAGSFARDKDAICAAMLLSEACVVYKEQGKTLYDVLQEMYATYGYFKEAVKSYTLEGKAGIEKIGSAMAALRRDPPAKIGGEAVSAWEDFIVGERRTAAGAEPIGLPKSDVLRYFLPGGAWLCIRPSGTEPKLKLYIGASAQKEALVDERLANLLAGAEGILGRLLD